LTVAESVRLPPVLKAAAFSAATHSFFGIRYEQRPGAQKGKIAVWTHEVRPKGEGHGCPDSIITAIHE